MFIWRKYRPMGNRKVSRLRLKTGVCVDIQILTYSHLAISKPAQQKTYNLLPNAGMPDKYIFIPISTLIVFHSQHPEPNNPHAF